MFLATSTRLATLPADRRERDQAHALAEEDRVGIVRFTMRKRRYHGVLLGEQGHLVLVTLLDPRTLVLPSSLPAAGDSKALDAQQLQLAEQLVEIMRAPFDPASACKAMDERFEELVWVRAVD